MSARGRRWIVLWAAPVVFALFCRVSPDFTALLLDRVTRPGLMALHRLTARVPFPVVEPLAFAAAVVALAALAAALGRAVRRSEFAPLLGWLKGVGAAALALLWALTLLWLPALLAPVEAPPMPDAGQLEWLCGALIEQLNREDLSFSDSAEVLRLAPEVAKLPGGAVKAARYPEWMRRAGISGLFVPITGEALVNADAPAPLVPFTAVHELMHLSGVADEGAANIAAWERCVAASETFANSARLWALRYALGLLNRADPEAWRRVRGQMKGPLSRVFADCGGEACPRGRCALLPGLARACGDYADLAGWLAQ